MAMLIKGERVPGELVDSLRKIRPVVLHRFF
jgi:hypothetical protein